MEFILEPTTQQSDRVWDNYVPIIQRGNVYDVYLTDHIEAPSEYNQLIHLLNSLESYQDVNIYINNGGGQVDSGFMISDALTRCKATSVCHLSGTVASAATIIALACDKLVASPFLSFMVHNYFHNVSGTGNQVKDYVDFTDRELKRAFNKIYTNFLTEKEIVAVTKRDREIWLNEVEVMERFGYYSTNQPVPDTLSSKSLEE